MARYLVTGANGHVGNTLVRHLQQHGHTVRATVRDATDKAKTRQLKNLDAELVSADILDPDSLTPAMAGMDGVFQVAAVYRTQADDPEEEIIRPSVEGGVNVIRAAHAAGVRRVVFTSSVAAVGSHGTREDPLTEDDWNDASESPYYIAKTRGEREAWRVAEELGLDMVVVNPAAIVGPGFAHHTPSTAMFEMALKGKLPVAPPFHLSFVDVRDVAEAHRRAMERTMAKGRYIVATEDFPIRRLLKWLHDEVDPEVRVPFFTVPKAMLPLAVGMDALGHRLLGMERQLTPDLAKELGGRTQIVSTERARTELGWSPRPMAESFRDTLDWIRARWTQRH